MSTPTTASADTTAAPLLWPRDPDTPPPRPATLAALLSRASSRRGASSMVRETAARQLEERRADWGYSMPVVALDMCWNLVFVVASAAMLFFAKDESPVVPLRVWICVYAAQCAVHVVLVYVEYRRRRRRNVGNGGVGDDLEANYRYADDYDTSDEEEEVERARVLGNFTNRRSK